MTEAILAAALAFIGGSAVLVVLAHACAALFPVRPPHVGAGRHGSRFTRYQKGGR